MAQISSIYTAPVKSFALNEHDHVEVDVHGISEDRRFYVIDAKGHLLTQRQKGKLTQIKACYEEADNLLTLQFPDGNKLSRKIERMFSSMGNRCLVRYMNEAQFFRIIGEQGRRDGERQDAVYRHLVFHGLLEESVVRKPGQCMVQDGVAGKKQRAHT